MRVLRYWVLGVGYCTFAFRLMPSAFLIVPLRSAGEGGCDVFQVDDAAVSGMQGGGRGVEQQRAHQQRASARNRTDDRRSVCDQVPDLSITQPAQAMRA